MTNSVRGGESLALNSKGQCPPCGKKPLTYKREKQYFCWRCDRAYSMVTKEQIPNWAWMPDGSRRNNGGS
jgi:hypothetical protein